MSLPVRIPELARVAPLGRCATVEVVVFDSLANTPMGNPCRLRCGLGSPQPVFAVMQEAMARRADL